MNLWRELIDAIFPEHCLACGRKGASLCAICERTIISRPMLHEDWLTTLFDYHQPIVKKAIQDLKYNHRRGVAEYFGNALYREFFSPLARKPKDAENIVLVPIPGGAEGNTKRGYNHAAQIAEAVAAIAHKSGFKIQCELDVIYKTKEVGRQAASSGRSAREKNVAGVFAVRNPEKIFGKHVVLVDDVMTTGETMHAAKDILLAAGAKKVIGMAVAH